MSSDSQDIEKLIEYVGGKDNIDGVSYCATRLRFILKDTNKLDYKKTEELNFVKGSFYQGGQFQVIIGSEVTKYYNKIIEDGKIKPFSDGLSHQGKTKSITWIQKIKDKMNKTPI